MNNDISEECSGKQMEWPGESAAMLLFDSDQDFDFVKSIIPSSSSANVASRPTSVTDSSSKFYVNNPDIDKVSSGPSPVTPDTDPSSSVDLLGLSSPPPSQPIQKKEDSQDRKSTRLNSSHSQQSRMPSSA